MSKTSHAAARVSQEAEKPKATLPQLSELVAQMHKGLIDRDYMQGFLRRRLVLPSHAITAVLPPQPTQSEAFVQVEAIVREHYPHAVDEILRIVAPFCDPNLDFEFKPSGSQAGKEKAEVREALFWLEVNEVVVLEVGRDYRGYPREGESLSNRVYGGMYADVFRTYDHMNTVSTGGASRIIHVNRFYANLHDRFNATGAVKYGLVGGSFREEGSAIVGSIAGALQKAIVFAATGDERRRLNVMRFLDKQRSGQPIVHWHEGTAYVLTATHARG